MGSVARQSDPPGPERGENRRIARAAGLISGLTLASRVTGLLRDVATGYFFGAGPLADAFFVAFRLPNLLRRFVGEGAMSVAFVPVFTEYAARGRDEAQRALRAVATGFGLLLLALTLLGVLFAPGWLALLAPGFAAEPETAALTVTLTRWLFLYLPLICLVAVYGAWLNVRRHFLVPALSPVLLNLAIIAAAALLSARFGIRALVFGVLAGGLLQVGAHLVVLRAGGIAATPLWAPAHPALRRALRLLAPAALGAAMYQINVLLSTSLATLLPTGSVSALWYAGRLLEFPIGLVAVALGTAALPSFADQAARGAHEALRRSLAFALALTNYVALPAALGLLVLAEPITAVLFQRGAFTTADVGRTAAALQAYAVGLWALAVVRVVAPAFYALRDVRTPLRAAGAAFVINLAASLALVGPLPEAHGSRLAAGLGAVAGALQLASLAQVGLALAASLAVTLNAVLLLAAIHRRLGGLDLARFGASLLRAALACAPMLLVAACAARGVDWTADGGLLTRAAALAAIIAAAGAVYAGAAWLLGGPEIAALRRTRGASLERDGNTIEG